MVILVVGTRIGIWWVMRYAARVKADPSASLLAGEAADAVRRAVPAAADDAVAPAGR